MKAIAFIFARGGSKGLPGKNIRSLGGKPLIAWSIEHALAVNRIESVIVSTDSEEIKDISRKDGALVIDRPAYLCTKEALGEDAYLHGYGHIKNMLGKDIELMVLLFVTRLVCCPRR